MPTEDQQRAPANRRLAEALARALLKQRTKRQGAVLAAPPIRQFAGDTLIEPPYRYWDRLPFDPRPLDQIPAPLTPPLPFGPSQHGANSSRLGRNDPNNRDPWSHDEDPLGIYRRKRLRPLLRDIGMDLRDIGVDPRPIDLFE